MSREAAPSTARKTLNAGSVAAGAIVILMAMSNLVSKAPPDEIASALLVSALLAWGLFRNLRWLKAILVLVLMLFLCRWTYLGFRQPEILGWKTCSLSSVAVGFVLLLVGRPGSIRLSAAGLAISAGILGTWIKSYNPVVIGERASTGDLQK